MNYDRFVGLVQNKAHMPSAGDAVGAIRATLTTLAERIDAGEADDLAAQLPREIGYYLRANPSIRGERFSFGEFCERVAMREYCDLPDAVFHARCVIEVMEEAVSRGEIRDVRGQLPRDFQPLFEAGSQGRMRQRQGRGGGRRAGQAGGGGEETSRRRDWRDEPLGGWRGGRGGEEREEYRPREREVDYAGGEADYRGREPDYERGEYRGASWQPRGEWSEEYRERPGERGFEDYGRERSERADYDERRGGREREPGRYEERPSGQRRDYSSREGRR